MSSLDITAPNDGLAASNVRSNTNATSTSRVTAFRSGLLNQDTDACHTRFP